MIKINQNFEDCINSITGGRKTLEILRIAKYYYPNPNFIKIDNGEMYYSIPNIVPQQYVAAFDLDWTLTACQKKLYPGSASADDIILLPGRRKILTELFKSGYTIAIFTNQKSKKVQKRINRVSNFIKKLGIPCYAFIATGNDHYRKPEGGMWKKLQELIPNLKFIFYVGDAAGRPQDFSDSDKQFAIKARIPFYTPEQFFPCQRVAIPEGKNMVVLVGAPGSGKSSFARLMTAKNYHVVSKDNTQSKYLKTLRLESKIFDNIVADSTNNKQIQRQKIYRIAQTAGMNITVIYFLRDGYGWNKLRKKPVPAVAYHVYYKYLEPPTTKNTPGNVIVVTELCQ